MASYHHQMNKLHQEQESRKAAAAAIKEDNKLFNPMNLPQNTPKPLTDNKPGDRDESPRGPGRRPGSGAGGLDSPRQFSAFHDDLGTPYVNPATGKK